MSAIEPIRTPLAGPPHGHYEQAVVAGGLVYASGILGRSELAAGETRTIVDEAEYCLAQLRHVLEAAGSGLDRVAKLTLYVTDVEHWPRVNAVCARHFGAHRPARSIVTCPALRLGSALEIDAIALAGRSLNADRAP